MSTSIPDIKAAYEHTKAGTLLFSLCAKWTKFLVKHRWLYYLTASVWGVIMTLIGLFVSGILAVVKFVTRDEIKITFRPFHWIYSISVGSNCWGGLSLGLCFLRDHKTWGGRLNAHEFGHTFQNCLFGPIFPFIVWIPSVIWYWSGSKKPYDSMWFEDAATQCGLYAVKALTAIELDKLTCKKEN